MTHLLESSEETFEDRQRKQVELLEQAKIERAKTEVVEKTAEVISDVNPLPLG